LATHGGPSAGDAQGGASRNGDFAFLFG